MPRPRTYTEEESRQRQAHRTNEYRKRHLELYRALSKKHYDANKEAICKRRKDLRREKKEREEALVAHVIATAEREQKEGKTYGT